MISYDAVILKRLRFKGEPEVPEISAAEIGLALADPAEIARTTKEPEKTDNTAVDNRTEAEKSFEKNTVAQEQRRLRVAAGATYREQVDKFNERLAKEPEHYDLFKISFTK